MNNLFVVILAVLVSSNVFAKGVMVEMKTSLGTMVLELDNKKAKVSVDNFLKYTNSKFYDGTVFHRVISGFMIQGGGFNLKGERLIQKKTRAAIKNESKNGLKNVRGSIAMARTNAPHSATSQFFINHKDNGNLDYPSFDGWGYAVFGKVVKGLDVLDKIAAVETGVKSGMQDVPLKEIKIISVKKM